MKTGTESAAQSEDPRNDGCILKKEAALPADAISHGVLVFK